MLLLCIVNLCAFENYTILCSFQVGNLPALSVQTNGTISSGNSVHKKELESRPPHRKSDSVSYLFVMIVNK